MSEKKVTISLALTADQINAVLAQTKGQAQDFYDQFKKGAEEAGEKVNTFGQKAKSAFEGLKGVAQGALSVFTGNLLSNGIQGITGSLEGLIDKGEKSAEVVEAMDLAFTQAGLSGKGLEDQFERTNKSATEWGAKLRISSTEYKQVAAQAGFLGGATGETNDKVAMLATGIQKATKMMGGAVIDSTAVIKAFTGGLNDPEAEASLGRLKKSFPQLATALKGVTDPAQQLDVAMKVLTPTFDKIAEGGDRNVGQMETFRLKIGTFTRTIGELIFGALSPLITVLSYVGDGINIVTNVFKNMPGPVALVLKILGGLVAVVAAYSIVQNLSILKTIASTTATIAHAVVTNAVAVATGIWTGAQWLLNAALNANPISIIIIAIAALVGGIIYAYNHSEAFRKILNGLWDAIKEGVLFFLKWLNPIGLMIQAFKFLYNNVGFVKDGIDALVGAVKGVIDTIANAGKTVLKFLGIMSDETEQEKKTKEAVEATTKAEELRGQTIADTVKAYEELRKSQEDSIKEDESTINALKMRIRMGGEFQKLANGQKVWVKDTVESAKQVQDAIDQWFAHGKEIVKQQKIGTEEDIATRKKLGLAETEKTKDVIAAQKDLYESHRQSLASTISNINAILAKHKGSSDEEIKIQKDGSKAIEDLVKQHNENLLTLAGSVDNELQKKLLDSTKSQQESLVKMLKAYREENYESVQGMKDEEIAQLDGFRSLRLDMEKRYANERIALIKESIKKEKEDKQKVQLETLSLKTQELLIANAIQKQSDESRAYNTLRIQHDSDIAKATIEIADENARHIKILELDKKFNEDRYKIQEGSINRQKELRDLAIDIDRSKSDGEKKVALIDSQNKAENAKLEEQLRFGLVTQQAYELQKAKLEQTYHDAHYAATKDMLEKESILYQSAMLIANNVIKNGVAKLKGALQGLWDFFFKKQHDEQKKADQAEAMQRKSEKDKKLKDLQDQLRESKISYEEYVTQKQKLDDDYNKSKENNSAKEKSIAQDTADALAAIAESALTKIAEKKAEELVIDLVTNQAKATGAFIASVAAMPFPLNAILIAGAAALIGGLFVGLFSAKGKKAAKGMRVNKRPGGEIIQAGEGDENEFVAPEETFLDYAHKDLTPKILDRIGGSFDERIRRVAGGISATAERTYNRFSKGGNIFPPLARDLSPRSGRTSGDHAIHSTLQRLENVLAKIANTGIPITGESRTSGDTLIHTLRNANKNVQNRAYPGSRFIAPNSNL